MRADVCYSDNNLKKTRVWLSVLESLPLQEGLNSHRQAGWCACTLQTASSQVDQYAQ